MICSRKTLLSILLLASAACLATAEVVINGFVLVQGGLVRQTSNANVQLNAQFARTATVQTSGNSVIFLNEIVSITNGTNSIFPAISITRAVAYAATYPLPKVFITKTTATIGTGFSFNTQSSVATFPAALEYNEVNNQNGFQAGADKLVQLFDLKENLNSWNIFSSPTNWNTLALTTEMWPMAINATKNASVSVATSCNKVNGFCFTFRFSNAMYVRNGVTYLPDAVKVDMLANTSKFNTTTGMLALLSSMLSTSDSLNLTDMHAAVDNTMAQAKANGGTAVVSADFMFSFNAQNNNSAYLNYARTAILTSAANTNSTITVMAEVVKSANASILVQSMINVNYANQASQIDTNFQSMTTVESIVYSFLAANNGATSITWDPEVGVANVNTSNQVIGGKAAGLSAGAIAGIVIAVVAVAGVAGFFGVRAIRNKKSGKKGLLG